MIEIGITLSADKYLDKYASWLEEFDLRAVRITDVNDVSQYPLIVLSGGGDLGVETGAYTCSDPEKRIADASLPRHRRKQITKSLYRPFRPRY